MLCITGEALIQKMLSCLLSLISPERLPLHEMKTLSATHIQHWQQCKLKKEKQTNNESHTLRYKDIKIYCVFSKFFFHKIFMSATASKISLAEKRSSNMLRGHVCSAEERATAALGRTGKMPHGLKAKGTFFWKSGLCQHRPLVANEKLAVMLRNRRLNTDQVFLGRTDLVGPSLLNQCFSKLDMYPSYQ